MSSKMKKTARHIIGVLLALLICVQPFLLYGMVSAEPAPTQDETAGELTPEPATPEQPTPEPETPAPATSVPETPVPDTPTPVPDTPTPVPDTPTTVPDTPTPTPEVTPEPETPTPEPSSEVTPTPTPEVTPSPETPTPEPEVTDVPEPTPEVTPTQEVTPTPTVEITPVPLLDALELDSGVPAADGLTHIALKLTRDGGYPANVVWKIEILRPDELAQLTASEPELAEASGLAVRFSVEADGLECDLTGSEAVFTGLDPALIDGGRLSLYRDYAWRKLDVQYSRDTDSVGLAKAKFKLDRSGVLFFFNPAPEVTPEPETPLPEETPTPSPEVTPAVGSLDTAAENLSGGG